MQTYLIVAAIYVVVNLLLSRFAVWLERRLSSRTRARSGPTRGRARSVERNSDTGAATIRQPCASRTHVCVCRPSIGRPG